MFKGKDHTPLFSALSDRLIKPIAKGSDLRQIDLMPITAIRDTFIEALDLFCKLNYWKPVNHSDGTTTYHQAKTVPEKYGRLRQLLINFHLPRNPSAMGQGHEWKADDLPWADKKEVHDRWKIFVFEIHMNSIGMSASLSKY